MNNDSTDRVKTPRDRSTTSMRTFSRLQLDLIDKGVITKKDIESGEWLRKLRDYRKSLRGG